jgi:hypothetical protein
MKTTYAYSLQPTAAILLSLLLFIIIYDAMQRRGTALPLQMVVFWFVTQCNLVKAHKRFRGSCYLHQKAGSDDKGWMRLSNVGKPSPAYTVLQPRIKPSHIRRRRNLKPQVYC